jgi:hypothetical protein
MFRKKSEKIEAKNERTPKNSQYRINQKEKIMIYPEKELVCDACKNSLSKRIKGMCKHIYERQRYQDKKKFRELRSQKTIIREALGYILDACQDDNFTTKETLDILIGSMYKLQLLFSVSAVKSEGEKQDVDNLK